MSLKRWAGAGAVGLALAAVLALSACGTTQRLLVPATEAVLDDAVLRLPARCSSNAVILTIDDAPSSRTDEILDLLQQHAVTATFFVHTDQIMSRDRHAAMARIAAEGHDLAHHMPNDQAYGRVATATFDAAFRQADAVLSGYPSAHLKAFRPPRASYRSGMMDETLARYGYDAPLATLAQKRRYILASFIPWDAAAGSTDTDDPARNAKLSKRYTEQLLRNLYPGAIVIFHDGEEDGRAPRLEATLGSLPLFIERATAQGFELISLSEGIARCAAAA